MVLLSKQCFTRQDLFFFIRKQGLFDHLEQHLNPMSGSSFMTNFLLTKIGPRRVFTCSRV